jgi:hypothetical protein
MYIAESTAAGKLIVRAGEYSLIDIAGPAEAAAGMPQVLVLWKAGDQPSATEDVHHGEFLGAADRWIVERDAIAHDHQRCIRSAASEGRCHPIGLRP